MRKLTPFAILVATLVGCGGLESELTGIYEITAWTENATACDAEGPSILAGQQEAWFYVRVEDLLGQEFLNAAKCADLATCKTESGDDTIQFNGWTFENGDDAKGWRGTTVFAGGSGGQCSGGVTDHVMTSLGADAVQIESREREARPFSADGEGFCTTDDAIAAAEGEPCVSLEVVTATRSASL